MSIRRIGIIAAIFSTFGFSCYNEPHYEREGMNNPPGGSGGPAAPMAAAPSASPSAASSAPATTTPGASPASTSKRP